MVFRKAAILLSTVVIKTDSKDFEVISSLCQCTSSSCADSFSLSVKIRCYSNMYLFCKSGEHERSHGGVYQGALFFRWISLRMQVSASFQLPDHRFCALRTLSLEHLSMQPAREPARGQTVTASKQLEPAYLPRKLARMSRAMCSSSVYGIVELLRLRLRSHALTCLHPHIRRGHAVAAAAGATRDGAGTRVKSCKQARARWCST